MESCPAPDRDSHASATPPGIAAMLKLADAVPGFEALERMLLAYAVHRDGVGFERAHLLLYDAASDELIPWAGAGAALDAPPIGEALARAALAPAPAPHAPPLRQIKWPAPSLEGLVHLAWESGPVALHVPDGAAAAEGALLLVASGHRYGLIAGGWESGVDVTECRRRLERFHAVAREVLTACERERGAQRAQARLEALAEMSHAAVSSLNVAEVLHLAVEGVARDADIAGAAVWTVHGPESLRLEVTHGVANLRERAGRALQPLAAAVVSSLQPSFLEEARDAALLAPAWADSMSHIAVLPLVAYGRAFGALAVYAIRDGRPRARPAFDPAARRYLTALADDVALALDQAERCAEHKRAAERERELRQRLLRLAPLAEFGAGAAERVRAWRNPVASILAFARRAHAATPESDTRREYFEIVMREAERLDGLLQGVEDPPVPGAPSLERVQPNDLVQHVVQKMGEQLVRRRIRLVKKLSPEVPSLVLDRARVREALANLLAHALEAVAVGGRLKVESRKTQGHVVIEIAHDGAREPGSALDRLFVPFAARGQGGAASLGMAERIVREHGGEIRTRSEGEWSAVIAFTLPIHDNEDRRRPGGDRRRSSHDRRARVPESLGG